jgi:hypothetical protein
LSLVSTAARGYAFGRNLKLSCESGSQRLAGKNPKRGDAEIDIALRIARGMQSTLDERPPINLDDSEPRLIDWPLTSGDKLLLSMTLVYAARNRWFEKSIQPPPDRQIAILFFAIYFYAEMGLHLSKKQAWKSLEYADIKTARKHISNAEKLGLIRVMRSKKDKRVSLLAPTPRLEELIHSELLEFRGAALPMALTVARDYENIGRPNKSKKRKKK